MTLKRHIPRGITLLCSINPLYVLRNADIARGGGGSNLHCAMLLQSIAACDQVRKLTTNAVIVLSGKAMSSHGHQTAPAHKTHVLQY
jgi:hypothetical protein